MNKLILILGLFLHSCAASSEDNTIGELCSDFAFVPRDGRPYPIFPLEVMNTAMRTCWQTHGCLSKLIELPGDRNYRAMCRRSDDGTR